MSRNKFFGLIFISLFSSVVGTTLQATNETKLLVTSKSIIQGYTKDFALNCSFSLEQGSDFNRIMSLILSKSDNQDETYTELASISAVNPYNVVIKDPLGAEVSGLLLTSGHSFISLVWQYPDHRAVGTYKCESFGIEGTGHPMVSSATVTVSETFADVEIVLEKLKLLDNIVTNQTTRQGELEAENNNHKSQINDLKGKVNDQQREINALNTRMSQSRAATFELTSSVYKNHQYMLSRVVHSNFAVANSVCRVHGGYLIEIDDLQEFNVIKTFLDNNHVKEIVGIGGTDVTHDGTWTFLYSGQNMTYFNWEATGANGGTNQNCLLLWTIGREMYDYGCYNKEVDRFLCEIPV